MFDCIDKQRYGITVAAISLATLTTVGLYLMYRSNISKLMENFFNKGDIK